MGGGRPGEVAVCWPVMSEEGWGPLLRADSKASFPVLTPEPLHHEAGLGHVTRVASGTLRGVMQAEAGHVLMH